MMNTEVDLPEAPAPVRIQETFRTSSRVPRWMEALRRCGIPGKALYSILLFLWF
jgi:hypothetical protein